MPEPASPARRIYVWPDGTWLDAEEHEDALDAWRGDDCLACHVPGGLLDEAVDQVILELVSGRDGGERS